MLPKENFGFSCLSRPILGSLRAYYSHEDNTAKNANSLTSIAKFRGAHVFN